MPILRPMSRRLATLLKPVRANSTAPRPEVNIGDASSMADGPSDTTLASTDRVVSRLAVADVRDTVGGATAWPTGPLRVKAPRG